MLFYNIIFQLIAIQLTSLQQNYYTINFTYSQGSCSKGRRPTRLVEQERLKRRGEFEIVLAPLGPHTIAIGCSVVPSHVNPTWYCGAKFQSMESFRANNERAKLISIHWSINQNARYPYTLIVENMQQRAVHAGPGTSQCPATQKTFFRITYREEASLGQLKIKQ